MKIPTPEERAKALLRIEKQTSREVAKCFSDLVDRVTAKVGAFPPGVLPLFAEGLVDVRSNPAFAHMLDSELTRFAGELEEANERGVTRAWTLSDHYGDIDTRGYLKRTGATTLLSRYTLGTKEAQTAHRAEAVRAFLDRRDRKGFTISGRVWRTAEQAMQHIETSLSEGLAEGRSAAELSRTIRQDLREPDRLFRRVRDKNGNLQLSKSARAYHPGTGVYRSSYKNALRLTRTEINVSYAEADFERWQRLDFVIGYEVRLSNNHTCNGHPFTDICDELAGKYPKWFKFTKWHPQCRCVCLAIFDDDPGAGEVRDVPANFKQWVTDNQPRLDRSIKKGTAPYWVRDNFSKQGKLTGAGRKPATPRTAGGGSKPPKPPVATTTAPADPDEDRRRRTLERAKARHEARTPEEVQEIHKAWSERRAVYHYGENVLKTMGGISDIDTSSLSKALRGGNQQAVLLEGRKLVAQGKQITGLKGIPAPLQVAREYSAEEAKQVNDAVLGKLKTFKGLPEETLLKKLQFEAEWVEKHKKYSTWKVAKDAYEWHAKRVEETIYWKSKTSTLEALKAFETKSKAYKTDLKILSEAIHSSNKTEAEQAIARLEKKRSNLLAKRAKNVKTDFPPSSYTQERKNNAVWDKGNGQLADDTLFNNASQAWTKASGSEKNAIYGYTESYCHINEPLQGRTYVGRQTREAFENDVNAITSYIDRVTLPRDMWFQRGEDSFRAIESRLRFAGETVPDNLEGLVGKVMQEGGFMSTASRKGSGFQKPVIVNIYAPKGTKATYVEPFSRYGHGAKNNWDGKERFSEFGNEQETLFQRGTKMRITKVEQSYGTIYIDCEVIGQETKPLSYIKDKNIGY